MKMLPDATGDILESINCHLNSMSINGHLNSIPVEPEWKEDDIYFRHRKDALIMMRSASYHSRAASDALVRGNHDAAKQLFRKAREERLAAERLHAEAAKQILTIKNRKNNMWKLDLHGLHAKEAAQALKEHLQKIEQLPFQGDRVKTSFERASSPSHMAGEKVTTIKKSPTHLLVITGRGKHSRGEPKLPTAIKNFLRKNRYQFDDHGPGAIAVLPKLRYE